MVFFEKMSALLVYYCELAIFLIKFYICCFFAPKKRAKCVFCKIFPSKNFEWHNRQPNRRKTVSNWIFFELSFSRGIIKKDFFGIMLAMLPQLASKKICNLNCLPFSEDFTFFLIWSSDVNHSCEAVSWAQLYCTSKFELAPPTFYEQSDFREFFDIDPLA